MTERWKAEASRWLQQAECDYETAVYNQTGTYHNIACFLAQQAAEKALKAFLYASGVEVVRGHAVLELAEHAGAHDANFALRRNSARSRQTPGRRYRLCLPCGLSSNPEQETEGNHTG